MATGSGSMSMPSSVGDLGHTTWDGWSALAGTCTASWPPGRSDARQPEHGLA